MFEVHCNELIHAVSKRAEAICNKLLEHMSKDHLDGNKAYASLLCLFTWVVQKVAYLHCPRIA